MELNQFRDATRAWQDVNPRPAKSGPTIIAELGDGPLAGRSIETEVVEGRPPKIIDVPLDDRSGCRYCLADWVQSGPSAMYAFLYRVDRMALAGCRVPQDDGVRSDLPRTRASSHQRRAWALRGGRRGTRRTRRSV